MVKGECVTVMVRRLEPSMRIKETGPAFVVDMVAEIIDGGRSAAWPAAAGSRRPGQREAMSFRQKKRQTRGIANAAATHMLRCHVAPGKPGPVRTMRALQAGPRWRRNARTEAIAAMSSETAAMTAARPGESALPGKRNRRRSGRLVDHGSHHGCSETRRGQDAVALGVKSAVEVGVGHRARGRFVGFAFMEFVPPWFVEG